MRTDDYFPPDTLIGNLQRSGFIAAGVLYALLLVGLIGAVGVFVGTLAYKNLLDQGVRVADLDDSGPLKLG